MRVKLTMWDIQEFDPKEFKEDPDDPSETDPTEEEVIMMLKNDRDLLDIFHGISTNYKLEVLKDEVS